MTPETMQMHASIVAFEPANADRAHDHLESHLTVISDLADVIFAALGRPKPDVKTAEVAASSIKLIAEAAASAL